MSNTKKKSYKKRKQAAHTKIKAPNNVPVQPSKAKVFLDNWLWLITLIVIIVVVALMIILIPKCDAACSSCDSCKDSAVVSQSDSGDDIADEVLTADSFVDSAPAQRASFPDVAQFQLPADGEEIAVLETSMGTIKIRLFPNAAPKAVENFKGLINQGYYDGVIFHRVISDFMIQSGSPDGTSSGGESIWGAPFEDELANGLHNYRGALSMANSGENTNGSQFFIVQNSNSSYDASAIVNMGLTEDVAAIYEAIGGTSWLDGETKAVTGYGHTVFGQVIEGMNVVDAIANTATDESDKPTTEIVITKASLQAYTAA